MQQAAVVERDSSDTMLSGGLPGRADPRCVAILRDAGHFFPFETPEEANGVMLEFLEA